MKYRDHEIRYDSDSDQLEAETLRQADGKDYRAKRSAKPSRRRATKSSTSHPGCGIAGRRKHRWIW